MESKTLSQEFGTNVAEALKNAVEQVRTAAGARSCSMFINFDPSWGNNAGNGNGSNGTGNAISNDNVQRFALLYRPSGLEGYSAKNTTWAQLPVKSLKVSNMKS